MAKFEKSGKFIAVHVSDPTAIDGPVDTREEAQAALDAWAIVEGEDFDAEEWTIVEFSTAALAEYETNCGSIEEFALVDGVICTESEAA